MILRGAGLMPMNFITPIRPPHLAVYRVLAWIELIGHALADDHHPLAAILVAVVEVAALQDGHAHGAEETRRNGAELRPKILSIQPMRAIELQR